MVDRLVITGDADELAVRLADSLETALGLTDGLAFADYADRDERIVFSARFACPESGFTIDEIEPRLFSFNNPFGACTACDGLGVSSHFERQLVVPDGQISLRNGALAPAPWSSNNSRYFIQALESLAKHSISHLMCRLTILTKMCSRSSYTGLAPYLLLWNLTMACGLITKKPFEGVFQI